MKPKRSVQAVFTTTGITTMFCAHRLGIEVKLCIDTSPAEFTVHAIGWTDPLGALRWVRTSDHFIHRAFFDFGAEARAAFIWKAIDRVWALAHDGAQIITTADLGWEVTAD